MGIEPKRTRPEIQAPPEAYEKSDPLRVNGV